MSTQPILQRRACILPTIYAYPRTGLSVIPSGFIIHGREPWKKETMGFLDAYPVGDELIQAGPADRAWLQDHLLYFHSGHLDHWHGILRGGGGGVCSRSKSNRSGHLVKLRNTTTGRTLLEVATQYIGVVILPSCQNCPVPLMTSDWKPRRECFRYVKKPYSRHPG